MTDPAPAAIDTVRDVLAKLVGMFPKHRDEILAWSQPYQRVLGHLQPTRLREVFAAVIDGWEKGYPPKPADFKAKLGSDVKPEAPTNPQDVANGKRNRAIMEAHTRRDNLAKSICKATFEHYGAAIEEAAGRIGVAATDIRRRLENIVGWLGMSPRPKTRAYDAAHAHVFGGEPLVDFIRLTADDWNSARRYAEIKRDDPSAFDFTQPQGFRAIAATRRPVVHSAAEERRRENIEAAAAS